MQRHLQKEEKTKKLLAVSLPKEKFQEVIRVNKQRERELSERRVLRPQTSVSENTVKEEKQKAPGGEFCFSKLFEPQGAYLFLF
ncbi:MAG TPA: hypothetical protein DEG74_02355 [Clostridiales bacterium]|nr:hypothetical protein [Clostridiales bacterium]